MAGASLRPRSLDFLLHFRFSQRGRFLRRQPVGGGEQLFHATALEFVPQHPLNGGRLQQPLGLGLVSQAVGQVQFQFQHHADNTTGTCQIVQRLRQPAVAPSATRVVVSVDSTSTGFYARVRVMRQAYYCTFLLGSSQSPVLPAMVDFAALCREWLRKPRAGVDAGLVEKLPGNLGASSERVSFSLGAKASLDSVRFTDQSHDCFAIRLKHPSAEDNDVTWLTEVCLAMDVSSGVARVSVAASFGRETARLSPLGALPSRPRIVRDIVDRWGGHEHYAVKPKTDLVTGQNVKQLVETIREPRRQMPVLFISARNSDDRTLVNGDEIADQLVGLCHVISAANRFPSLDLREDLGQAFNCWNGAVRIYWPGFTGSDNPFRHRLWEPYRVHEIEESNRLGFKGYILGFVSRIAVNRQVQGLASWNAIEALHNKRLRAKLLESGDLNELFQLADAEIKRLSADNERLQQELLEAQEKAEADGNKAESWRLAYIEAQKSPAGSAAQPVLPPTSVREVIDRIKSQFGKQVRFQPNSSSDVDDNPYEDCESLFKAFAFLATTYLKARTGEVPCPQLDVACKEASGFSYNAHQSDVTIGQNPADYHTVWKGKKVPLKEHVRKGTSREARHTIRIAFFYDAAERAVVIGYIGQHQTTATS